MRFDQLETWQSTLKKQEVYPEYLAGFFDGDGYVVAGKSRNDGYANGVPVTYFGLGVCTTVKQQPALYKERYGGGLHRHMDKRGNRSATWTWEQTGRSAKHPLEDLIPHLREKRPQAMVALKQVKKIRETGRKRISERLATERLEAVDEIERLKKQNRVYTNE